MKTKSTNKLLSEARIYREQGRFDDALANLHQVVNQNPSEPKYKYLLATTYFESENEDVARKYAQELINEARTTKESLELLGLINFKEKKYEEAEVCFKKALAIDPDFHNVRLNLIRLYKETDNYIEIDNHAKYIFTHRDVERNSLIPREKNRILNEWYALVVYALIRSLARQNKYEEAIYYTKDLIDFYQSSMKRPNILHSINEYGNIYKFTYLLGDPQKIEECKKEVQDTLGAVMDGLNENKFFSWEKYAEEGIF